MNFAFLSVLDHMTTGQFLVTLLGLFWVMYLIACELEELHDRRKGRRRAEAFNDDHNRPRLGR